MKFLITGGTGTLGQELTKKLLSMGERVVIYSRDEYKQHNMESKFKNKKLSFILGDIRDRQRTIDAFKGVDIVIHAAALKHVPVGEESPNEVIKTNILGTENVIEACKLNHVIKAVFVSTDKACHPTNLYGMTKAVSEKLFIQANVGSDTSFVCVRYGNVVGSRGSVVEYIQREHPKTIDLTSKFMTRFWISIDMAVDLVLLALSKAKEGEIVVPKAKACYVVDMFRWLDPKIKVVETGMRAGEKLHESMISRDESLHTRKNKTHFFIEPEILGAKYQFSDEYEYSSQNAPFITKEGFLSLI